MQRSHRFYNLQTLDDGPRSRRKYLGNNYLGELHQIFPAGYYEINSATGQDIYKTI